MTSLECGLRGQTTDWLSGVNPLDFVDGNIQVLCVW